MGERISVRFARRSSSTRGVGHEVLSSPVSDFLIEGKTFEVGGRRKGFDQLKGVTDGYVVADGIEYGHGHTVPLWAFGLSY